MCMYIICICVCICGCRCIFWLRPAYGPSATPPRQTLMYICTYVYVHVFVFVDVYVYVYGHACVYAHVYAYANAYQMYIYMYVIICICIQNIVHSICSCPPRLWPGNGQEATRLSSDILLWTCAFAAFTWSSRSSLGGNDEEDIAGIPSANDQQFANWKTTIEIGGFSHKKWWCSIIVVQKKQRVVVHGIFFWEHHLKSPQHAETWIYSMSTCGGSGVHYK